MGDRAGAIQLIREGLTRAFADQARWLVSAGAEATLLLLGESPEAERRAQLLGARDALAEVTGSPTGLLEAQSGLSLDALREQIERGDLQQAYRAGRALGLEDAAALALTLLEDYARTLAGGETAAARPAAASPLSEREQEVLRLVGEGLTSKQIGQRLFLSHRTVDHHLTAIFNKLGVDTRAQAVAVAAQRGLL
ncbi:MAG: helix-turn-helix transcriptional regulator [Chloroflexi bacterium]|nr:helix-turn-helix transcriptional regulator [Chloroflexota bacterium]